MTHLAIDLSHHELSPKQARAVDFRAPPHPRTGQPQIDHVGFFGDYGGGKSFAMMLRFILCCLANPFRHGVHSGDNPPMSGLVAPTASDLKRGPLAQLSRVLGDLEDEVIVKRVEYGQDQHWEMFNGHKILLYSAKGAKNGPTLVQIAADEYQERCYAGQWDNLKGRVRDDRAEWLNVMASGIAERGHVEDAWRLTAPDESGLPFTRRDDELRNRLVTLLYPEDNQGNMAAGYTEGMQAGGRRGRDQDGWLLPKDVMFLDFSRKLHLRMPRDLRSVTRADLLRRPTSIAVDPGRRAAVLWVQPHRGGLLVVDQFMPREMDAEELAAVIPRRGWNVTKDSVILLDPTMERDQVRHFRMAFPGARCVQHQRGFYHREENGLRAVKRALRDAKNVQRLWIAPWVHEVDNADAGHEDGRGRRGVVEMLGSHLATKPKDQWFEHAADVLRYSSQHFVPLPKMSSGISAETQRELSRVRPLTGGVKVQDLG